MQFCFIRDQVSLIMPVTPGTYQWSVGKRMETININEMGDVYRPGGRTRFYGNFTFLLPAQDYPWMEAGSRAEPQYYLDYLNAWACDEQTVRMVITGTEINVLVYIEDVTQGEQDGTGDRYVTVSVREHSDLEAVEVAVNNGTQNNGPGAGNILRKDPVLHHWSPATRSPSSAGVTMESPRQNTIMPWPSTMGSKIPT